MYRSVIAAFLAAFLLGAAAPAAAEPEPAGGRDPWAVMERLLGRWEGPGSSFGKASRVVHVYERAVQDRFLRMRTHSVELPAEGEPGASGAVHEDLGMFSYDKDRDKIVLRQFLSEGFVNTYALAREETGESGAHLQFVSESTEGAGGTRARLVYDLRGDDEYRLVLELAPPGEDFFVCQTMVMTRQK